VSPPGPARGAAGPVRGAAGPARGAAGAARRVVAVTGTADAVPVLLVVGSGERWYREYLLAGAAARHDLWLLADVAADWQLPYVAGAERLDVTDPGALTSAARRLAKRRPIAGLLCWDEALILPAAKLADGLGLRGPGAAAIQRCRDKAATRDCLARAGIPQPASVAVSSLAQAHAEAARIGYPVVLKPRALGASQGVVRADTPRQLKAGYADAAAASHPGVPRYRDGVLVEEYLDGPELSIDAAVCGGSVTLLTLARKQTGLAPYFEEVGHQVDGADPLLHDPDVHELLRAVHAALGVDHAITHTELRLTAAGPRVIEVNGRLGGDLIPYLGWLARGIDHGRVAAEVALGEPSSVTPRWCRAAAIRFGYPDSDCRVRQVHLPRASEGIVRADALVEPGQVIRLPPREYATRYGATVCVADDRAECERRLGAAAAGMWLDGEALGSPVPVPARAAPTAGGAPAAGGTLRGALEQA
jgi:biotin carboxylase